MQKDLAKRLGMSLTTLHRLELGDGGTTLRTLEHLWTVLDCTPNDLVEPGRVRRLPSRRRGRS